MDAAFAHDGLDLNQSILGISCFLAVQAGSHHAFARQPDHHRHLMAFCH
jgi:hypothetical protein